MELTKFKQFFTIDKARLLSYYERLQNQYPQLLPIQIISKFLNNQSIGASLQEIERVLEYYHPKIQKNKSLLDFAFEWIRAVKIRFEYKKYLSNSQFPNFEIALDDCIFLYFLTYDEYLRNLLLKSVKEFEISALYEIFFSPSDKNNLNFDATIEKYKAIVPTMFTGSTRINTNIITLRMGLSEIIKNDFDVLSPSRKRKKINR